MLRGQKVFFQATKADLDRLSACNQESARVWNECLRLAKEHFLQHGCWITKSEMQKQTKRKFHLHSQSIQAVCHQYLFARQAAHHAIQQGHPARYPYKKKKYFPTKWAKDGFKVYENGKIEFSMGIHHGKRKKPIVVYASHLLKGTIKEIECCWDQGLYLAVTYEDGQKEKRINRGRQLEPILGKYTPSARFAKTGKPSSSREERYAPFTGCGIKNWRRSSGANRNVKKDHADGKSMSGRHNTCYPNPKDSCGMRSIK